MLLAQHEAKGQNTDILAGINLSNRGPCEYAWFILRHNYHVRCYLEQRFVEDSSKESFPCYSRHLFYQPTQISNIQLR